MSGQRRRSHAAYCWMTSEMTANGVDIVQAGNRHRRGPTIDFCAYIGLHFFVISVCCFFFRSVYG